MARIDIRLSDAEKALVADAAKGAGLTVSEHVRRLALGEVSVSERMDDLDGRLVRLEEMVQT